MSEFLDMAIQNFKTEFRGCGQFLCAHPDSTRCGQPLNKNGDIGYCLYCRPDNEESKDA